MDLPDRSRRRRRHLRARRSHRLSRGDAAADRDDRVRRAHRRMDDRHASSSCCRPRSSPAISFRCSSRCSAARARPSARRSAARTRPIRLARSSGRSPAASDCCRGFRPTGAWRFAAIVLLVLGAVAVRRLSILPGHGPARRRRSVDGAGLGRVARRSWRSSRSFFVSATGPTAVWRHSGIGAGRVAPAAGVRLAEPFPRLGHARQARRRVGGRRHRKRRRAHSEPHRLCVHRQRQVGRQRARRRGHAGHGRPDRRAHPSGPATRARHRPRHGQHGRMAGRRPVDRARRRRRAGAAHPRRRAGVRRASITTS